MARKKEQLIEAAYETFYKHGFTASGVDKIIKEAGISKRTLYAYFESKDKLIEEVINYYSEKYVNFMEQEYSKQKLSPKEKILYAFDITKKWIKKNKHSGCLVSNAVTELNDGSKDIILPCQKFKIFERKFLEDLLKEAKVSRAEENAMILIILLEGAIVTSKVFGINQAIDNAKHAARKLLFSK